MKLASPSCCRSGDEKPACRAARLRRVYVRVVRPRATGRAADDLRCRTGGAAAAAARASEGWPPRTGRTSAAPEAAYSLTAADGTGLRVAAIDAKAVVEGPLAFTELHLDFDNPEARVREGTFSITLPARAAVSRFAVDTGSEMIEAEVVPKALARRAYDDAVHRGIDPAILEKGAGNQFTGRVFPIPAHGVVHVVVSYTQELAGEGYRLPLRGLPAVDRVSVELDELAPDGSRHVQRLRQDHWQPDDDFAATVSSPPGVGAGGLVAAALDVSPGDTAQADRPTAITLLVDTSASRAAGFTRYLDRVGALVGALADRYDNLQLDVVAFDQDTFRAYTGAASGFGSAALAALDDRDAAGASSLAGALAALAAAPPHRLVIVTDGVVTAGDDGAELTADAARLGADRVDVVLAGGVRDDHTAAALARAGRRPGDVDDHDDPLDPVAEGLGEDVHVDVPVDVAGATWSYPKVVPSLRPHTQLLVLARFAKADEHARRGDRRRAAGRRRHRRVAGAARSCRRTRGDRRARGPAHRDAGRRPRRRRRAPPRHRQALGRGARGVEPDRDARARERLRVRAIRHRPPRARRHPRDRRPRRRAAAPHADRHRAAPADGRPSATVDRARSSRASRPSIEAARASAGSSARGTALQARTSRRASTRPASTAASSSEGRWRSAPANGTRWRSARGQSPSGQSGDAFGNGYGRSGFGPGGGGAGRLVAHYAAVPSVAIGQPSVSGSLDKNILRRYIRRHTEQIRYCYERELLGHPDLAGTISTQFLIDSNGKVQAATASGFDATVASCVAGAISTIEFPAGQNGSIEVHYPFTFVRSDRRDEATATPEVAAATTPAQPETPAAAPPPPPAPPPPAPPPRVSTPAEPIFGPPIDALDGNLAYVTRAIAHGAVWDALAFARRWHGEQPTDVLAWVGLGRALEANGQLAEAARAYGSIIDLYASQASYRRFAGERLEHLGPAALALAIDSFRRAVADRPDQITGHRLLAYALIRARDFAGAWRAIRTGADQDERAGSYAGAPRVFDDDIRMIASAYAAHGGSRDDIGAELAQRNLVFATNPSTRAMLYWETDANDVDLHVLDAQGHHAFFGHTQLESGGELYADITTGFGPECFAIDGAPSAGPYQIGVHYYRQGAMGYGMGLVQVEHFDGTDIRVDDRPYVIMKDDAYIELGRM